jgi:uncharacterized membrane protein (DUF485 family)
MGGIMTTQMAEMVKPDGVQRGGATDNRRVIADLISAKARFLVPMIVIYMVGYVGLTVLAGFAKGFLAQKVAGALNLGYLLIAANYVLSLVLALVYVRVANTTFDPMVARAIGVASVKGGMR